MQVWGDGKEVRLGDVYRRVEGYSHREGRIQDGALLETLLLFSTTDSVSPPQPHPQEVHGSPSGAGSTGLKHLGWV